MPIRLSSSAFAASVDACSTATRALDQFERAAGNLFRLGRDRCDLVVLAAHLVLERNIDELFRPVQRLLLPRGALHAGEGATFEDFARLALAAAGLDLTLIEVVSMDTLARPAPRPRNSRLSCLVSAAIGLAEMPFWKTAVRDFVATGSAVAAAEAPRPLI